MFELQVNSEGESDICSKEHHLSSSENWTHDLCDTGAVLYQLSQANRELVILLFFSCLIFATA